MAGTLYLPIDVPFFSDPASGEIALVWIKFLSDVQAGLATVPWATVDKTGSSLADLATRSAAALNSGTLALARLSGITTTQLDVAAAITLAQLASMADVRLLGRSAGSAGVPQTITVGAGLSLAAGALTATAATPTTSTWIPSDQSGAALVLTVTNAQYFQYDSLVVASCDITYPVTADGSAMLLGGLPFTSIASTNAMWGGSINFTDEATAAQVRVSPGATTFLVATNTGGAITNATLSGNSLRLTMTYRK